MCQAESSTFCKREFPNDRLAKFYLSFVQVSAKRASCCEST
jgi:hypothetical protein